MPPTRGSSIPQTSSSWATSAPAITTTRSVYEKEIAKYVRRSFEDKVISPDYLETCERETSEKIPELSCKFDNRFNSAQSFELPTFKRIKLLSFTASQNWIRTPPFIFSQWKVEVSPL